MSGGNATPGQWGSRRRCAGSDGSGELPATLGKERIKSVISSRFGNQIETGEYEILNLSLGKRTLGMFLRSGKNVSSQGVGEQ